MITRAAGRLGLVFGRRSSTLGKLSQHRSVEESLARYTPGGYHPVRLGDKFSQGRYDIVCKLGYGLYSTVWLAFDQEYTISSHVSSTSRGSRDASLVQKG